MNEVQPLNPSALERVSPVPNDIIAVFNQLIKKNWNGTSSIVRVNEALGIICLLTNITSETIERNNWIESAKKLYESNNYVVTELGEGEDRCLEFRGI